MFFGIARPRGGVSIAGQWPATRVAGGVNLETPKRMPEITLIGQFITNVQPDSADLRDRLYNPTLELLEPSYNAEPFKDPAWQARVRHQGETNACTGFALAGMVEALRDLAWRGSRGQQFSPVPISPFMLYYFARRYDELPGDEDAGSTARGAMKAWHKHGACQYDLWPASVAGARKSRDKRWITDGFRTRLGAYFRVDHTSIADLHAAINETGVVYVTAQTHAGWGQADASTGEIPFDARMPLAGGHAFLLVGYDEHGFWIQNSWGPEWGLGGFARLQYSDWRRHSMDAWVGQLGVVMSRHTETMDTGLDFGFVRGAKRGGLSDSADLLSSNTNVSAQQITPYIIDLENNGALSDRGSFATRKEDLEELVSYYVPAAVEGWGLGPKDPIDVAIYCHGGLTPEGAAANTARSWVPALFAQKIFPVFIMWETGWDDTLKNIFRDVWEKIRGAAGASFWDKITGKLGGLLGPERVENLLSVPGTLAWEEMKENAAAASLDTRGGLHQLYEVLARGEHASLMPRLRFHLIGHSAGSIFHAFLANQLLKRGLKIDGIYFLAPACRSELFLEKLLPHYASGDIACYTQFHLSDQVELQDQCTELYHRSLLYLVSNAFERRRGTPILGMERFFAQDAQLTKAPARAAVWDVVTAPTGPAGALIARSNSTTHGGFDNDADTRHAVITRIVARKSVAAASARPPRKRRGK